MSRTGVCRIFLQEKIISFTREVSCSFLAIKLLVKKSETIVRKLKNMILNLGHRPKTNSKKCIGKPKDLWKAINSLGLPNRSGGCVVGALAENQIVEHDTKSILKTFLKFFIPTWQGLYWQNFQRCQIDVQLNLFLIITKNFHYLKI